MKLKNIILNQWVLSFSVIPITFLVIFSYNKYGEYKEEQDAAEYTKAFFERVREKADERREKEEQERWEETLDSIADKRAEREAYKEMRKLEEEWRLARMEKVRKSREQQLDWERKAFQADLLYEQREANRLMEEANRAREDAVRYNRYFEPIRLR